MKMKNLFITLTLFFVSITNSFSQLHFGIELALTTNQFFDSNLSTLVSNKSIIYLNYKFKNYVIESYYADDAITSFGFSNKYRNSFYEYGFLVGSLSRYASKLNFNSSIGIYNRVYSKKENIINDFGKKIGVTGKLQFGIELKKGFNTGITYRYFQDIYNLHDNQNQLLLNQSSFCFTLEIGLSEFYKKISKRKKSKTRKNKRLF